jgi:hypothetical protein
MKQRHIQSFLMVSAAFFAINAPIGGARANAPQNAASPVPRISQVRVPSAQTGAGMRRKSERSDDTAA